MLETIIYVSRSQIALADARSEVANIVATASQANRLADISGALIYTGGHFAQVLEGASEQLEPLMSRILADRRHREVNILLRVPLGDRRFAQWAMAYSGPSHFVDRHIAPFTCLRRGGSACVLAADRILGIATRFIARQPPTPALS
ncbi:blue light sensor protein [Sphingomonas changnyeongensis]|uniref:Blue light sensor protein n=1 Tax=Sphingomonas changnyeongensis TaxID=2698679 RepID=A0A7Z2NWL1_9SPHN|nr:BLUF domain-containing protein [Sphingomonas changnyeongensis]QHL90744.1 blue light sensor protein [Sphingomonas changnyeongensis]